MSIRSPPHHAAEQPGPSPLPAFGPDGHLADPKQEEKVNALGAALESQLKKQIA